MPHDTPPSSTQVMGSVGTNSSAWSSRTNIVVNANKLKLLAQSPIVQKLLRGSISQLEYQYMFNDPFPDDGVTLQYSRTILVNVARSLGKTDIKEHLKKDAVYARVLGTVVCPLYLFHEHNFAYITIFR